MKRTSQFRLVLSALLLACLVAAPVMAAPGATETFTERAEGFFDEMQKSAEQAQTHAFLRSHQLADGLERPIVVEASAADLAAIEDGVSAERRVRVGIAKEVGAEVRFGGLLNKAGGNLRATTGAMKIEGDVFTWTTAVQTPGSSAIRLNFANIDLAPGVELYISNSVGEVHGPYTGNGLQADGEFWAHTLSGPEAVIQLFYRGENPVRAARRSSFEIAQVGYITEKFLLGAMQQAQHATEGTKAFCSFNESCVENAACSSVPSAIAATSDGIAQMLYSSGAFLYICTGSLVADTDTGSQIPYFLTANHCISKSGEASSLETFFFFTTPCGGSCYNFQTAGLPGTVGSSILSGSSTSDYTLLQLDQPAPSGAAFLGWNTTAVAFNNGTSLFRLSHPGGAPQAYSEHSVDTSKGTCTSWPRGDWIYSTDTYGATEGGSSGSPVLNSNGQIVGQLSGACGFNVNDPCDTVSNATVDGAFAAYYSNVSQYLDPGTSCTDNDGDGFCASVDCDDNNASVNPGASEICGNGVDDDCDGTVDNGCGTCLAKGASCTSDSQCCSNKCKGKPGSQTCK